MNQDSLTLTPIYDETQVYFNYDALNFIMSGTTSFEYSFETDCLYNQYDLRKFFIQFGINDTAIFLESFITSTISMIDYLYGDYYMKLELLDTSKLTVNTFVKLDTDLGNEYNVVISDISGTTITVVSPLNYVSGEIVNNLTNINNVAGVSDVLQKVYENFEQMEYRKISIQMQRKIYNAYAEIINKDTDNQELRLYITGLIFENENNIMVLKIFDPADNTDERLLYEPIEIVRIGKDRKTTIPVTINEFSKGISADEINSNIYSVYLFDPRIEDVLVINANLS